MREELTRPVAQLSPLDRALGEQAHLPALVYALLALGFTLKHLLKSSTEDGQVESYLLVMTRHFYRHALCIPQEECLKVSPF